MFDLSNVQENAGGNGNLYIYPGVRNVTINGWASGTNQNGKDFIEVELTTVEAMKEGKENASKKFQFYLSDAARDQSLTKIKHIITKVAKEAQMTAQPDTASFVAMLNSISKGKSYRQKFTGEEYEYNGEIKTAARIGLPSFAEAINEGAEYPVVADADTKLTYDENNKYDFKKLAVDATPNPTASAPAGVNW